MDHLCLSDIPKFPLRWNSMGGHRCREFNFDSIMSRKSIKPILLDGRDHRDEPQKSLLLWGASTMVFRGKMLWVIRFWSAIPLCIHFRGNKNHSAVGHNDVRIVWGGGRIQWRHNLPEHTVYPTPCAMAFKTQMFACNFLRPTNSNLLGYSSGF